MGRSVLVKGLRAIAFGLPPAAFVAWAVRFAAAVATPAIPAFGGVEEQIAHYRAGLFASAAWGLVILAAWAGSWGFAFRARPAASGRRGRAKSGRRRARKNVQGRPAARRGV